MWFVDDEGRPQPARSHRPAPGIAHAAFGSFASFGWYLEDRRSPIISDGDLDVDDDDDRDGVEINNFPGSGCPLGRFSSKQWPACSTRVEEDEEVDSGLGSGGEASLGAVAPPTPPPPPAPPPPSPRHQLLLQRRRPSSTMLQDEERAALLRETAIARVLHGRVDELRAGASELRRAAQDLREEMEESEAHAQSLVCHARQLAEEMREVQHLDALLLWLSGPMPDVAVVALPDDDVVGDGEGPRHSPPPRSSVSDAATIRRACCNTPRRRIYSV